MPFPFLHHRQPWRGLPREAYHAPDLYAAELQRFWHGGWLYAGPEADLARPGAFFTVPLDSAPLLVVRGDDGVVRAFHNVCTHRGTLLCPDEHGQVGRAFVCHYHQWAFSRQGELLACRGMPPGQAVGELGLLPVHAVAVAGMVFVSAAGTPPDFSAARTALSAAEVQGFRRAKVARHIDYEVRANWKLVWENNRECYHCDANHPEYIKANFDIHEGERATAEVESRLAAIAARSEAYWASEGLSVKHTQAGLARFPDPDTGAWCSSSRTVMVEGYESESLDGKRVAPLMGDCQSPEAGVLRLRALPNFWCHASCDHAVITRLLPAGPRLTLARVTWLVDQDAVEGVDYQLDRVLPFWQRTSEQDWRLCELAQRGVDSIAYRPGPLSPTREYNLEAFLRWYCRRMGDG